MKRLSSLFLVGILLVSLSFSFFAEASSWSIWQNAGTSSSLTNPWNSSWGFWNTGGFGSYNPAPSKPIPQPQPQPSEPSQPNPIPQQPLQPITPQPKDIPSPSSSLTSLERQLIDKVNQERVANGLRPLQTDMTLVKLAKEKSHEMAATGNVTHHARSKFHAILDAAGVSYKMAGENLAMAASLTRVHNGLMNSSGHRANILSSSYTHIGVGIVQYGNMYYATEIFIGR